MRPLDAREAERAKAAMAWASLAAWLGRLPGPGARSLLGSRIENPEEPGAEPKREKFLTLPRCGRPRCVD